MPPPRMDTPGFDEILDGATGAWPVRLAMAKLGWLSSSRLMLDSKRACFQVWFHRYDWHGHPDESHKFHTLARVDADDTDAIRKIDDAVTLAAARARDAYALHPNHLACQGLEGEILRGREVRPGKGGRMVSPTEDLPDRVSVYSDFENGQPDAMMKVIGRGWEFDDKLDWFGINNADDTQWRRWRYGFRVSPRKWHDLKVARPGTYLHNTVHQFSEAYVTAAIAGELAALHGLATIYFPGGPRGTLPPGWITVDQYFVRFEMDIRAREIEACGTAPDPVELAATWNNRRLENSSITHLLPEVTVDLVETALANAPTTRSRAQAPSLRTWD